MIVASTALAGVVAVPVQEIIAAFGGMEDFIDVGIGDYGQYYAALDNPDSGILVINGLNSSSATVTVSMGGAVQIDVDEDGVAGFEATINTTWGTL
jgi:hypothetical protein